MLKVENISTGYGKKQVLFDVSFEVKEGEIVLLTGGNGSGKSTVLKCIYRLLPIWTKEGKITFNGIDVLKYKTSDLVKVGIVYIPQKNNCFESMTIYENLLASSSTCDKKIVKERLDKIYRLPYLYSLRNRKPFNLSGGERQLLALGIALMNRPRFILFDEPFAGLDEENVKIISKELLELKKQQISMLLVEHKKTFITFIDKEMQLNLGKINLVTK